MEEKRVNWKQVLFTAFITGIVTVTTGMILYRLQIQEADLNYKITETIPFVGEDENLAIFQVNIENSGKKVVKNIKGVLNFSPSNIKNYKTNFEPSLVFSDSVKNGVYKFTVDDLNPNEALTLSFLSSNKQTLCKKPDISIRGEGIKANEASEIKEKSPLKSILLPAILSAYAGLFVIFLMRISSFESNSPFVKLIAKMKGTGDDKMHNDDQQFIFSYLFNVRGDIEEAEKYLNKGSKKLAYWAESDRIAAIALKENDKEKAEMKKQILIDLLQYARIAPTSIGIIHLNIAKIAQYLGQADEYEEHIIKAKEFIPKLLSTRLKIDHNLNVDKSI